MIGFWPKVLAAALSKEWSPRILFNSFPKFAADPILLFH